MVHSFQQVIARRSVRRSLVVAGLVVSFAAGLSASAVLRTHDPRLDHATDNLVKAEALLMGTDPGSLARKDLKDFNKHLDRAIADVQDAMNEISAAIQAAGGLH